MLVFGLGAATLLLHDKHFIQLKPTVLFWAFGLAFLASFWIGKKTLTERVFSAALQDQVRVPERLWRRMNALWVVFYGLLGAANLLIAKYESEQAWVYSKVALTVVTLIFAIAQVLYLVKRGEQVAPENIAAGRRSAASRMSENSLTAEIRTALERALAPRVDRDFRRQRPARWPCRCP